MIYYNIYKFFYKILKLVYIFYKFYINILGIK